MSARDLYVPDEAAFELARCYGYRNETDPSGWANGVRTIARTVVVAELQYWLKELRYNPDDVPMDLVDRIAELNAS